MSQRGNNPDHIKARGSESYAKMAVLFLKCNKLSIVHKKMVLQVVNGGIIGTFY